MPEQLQKRLEKSIIAAIDQLIVYDEEKWGEYVPKPVDFAGNPNLYGFGVDKTKIENNLDFLIQSLEEDGKINPAWVKQKNYYTGGLTPAYNEWIGVCTLGALNVLKNYGRIEQ